MTKASREKRKQRDSDRYRYNLYGDTDHTTFLQVIVHTCVINIVMYGDSSVCVCVCACARTCVQ